MCQQLDTPCVIDLTLDMRRRTALQRTMEESRSFQSTLSGIVDVLRQGDSNLIQGLVTHIQQNDDEADLIETLQTRFEETRERNSQSPERRIKHEMQDGFNFMSDDEEVQSPDKSLVVARPSRKRPLFTHQMYGSRPSQNPSQHRSSGDQEDESLASRYLPLLSKLRNVSDLEATRILHDFKTSPIAVDGETSLNLFDDHGPRPSLDLHKGVSRISTITETRSSPDRAAWHPSLQLTSLEAYTPVARDTCRRVRSDDWNTTNEEGVCVTLLIQAVILCALEM